MTNSEKQKTWTENILDFQKSGKSKEAWCEKNNISLRQFSYWFSNLTKNQPTHWLPVEIKESEFVRTESIPESKKSPINIKIGAASIEVYPDFEKDFLLEILRILQSL
jgi:hypothetical protein